ncbi:hypothetical protein [Bordetella pertussis]|nr:hypothetical protein [Bordetella pertussis]
MVEEGDVLFRVKPQ